MIVYATVDDLANWTDDQLPDDAKQLLRSASLIVARAVNENPYADGVDTSNPKRDATCAQVMAWLATGIRPGSAGLQSTPTLKAEAMGDTRFEYDTGGLAGSADAAERRQGIAEKLSPEAEAILQAAGILWAPVPLFSGSTPGFVEPECRRWPLWDPGIDWWRS